MTYSTIKGVIEAVLVAQGLRRSSTFAITEEGACIQEAGYALVRKALAVETRLAERVFQMRLVITVHISTAYEPSAYDDNDDATGAQTEAIMVAFEEISIDTLAAQQISAVTVGESKTSHEADGRLHEEFDLTIIYRHQRT